MTPICTALILFARLAGGDVAIPAHQIAAVEDTPSGVLITTDRGAAWRVTGTARDIANQVREQCLLQRAEYNSIDHHRSRADERP